MEKVKHTINFSKRSAAFTELNQFCHHASDEDYMEVTMWSNYEGYDITVSDKKGLNTFSLTDGEFDALKKLIKSMTKQEELEFEDSKKIHKELQNKCVKRNIISDDDLPF
jgi:hypothetical protein